MKRVFSANPQEGISDKVFSTPPEDAPAPPQPAPIPPRSGTIGALTQLHRATIARIMARKPPATEEKKEDPSP